MSGNLWVYTFKAGSLGQRAYGSVTTSKADSMWSGTERPEKDFYIDTSYEQHCEYDIRSSSKEVVYEYSLKSWRDYVGDCDYNDAVSNCPNIQGSSWKRTLTTTCYCINRQPIVNAFGYFDNPRIPTQITIKTTVGNKVDEKIFDTSRDIEGRVGNYAYAVWQGDLNSEKSCPNPDSTEYMPIYVNSRWKIADANKYDEYKNFNDIFLAKFNDLYGTKPDPDFVESYISDINRRAYSFKDSSKSYGSLENQYQLIGAYAKKETESLIQYPVITMYLSADVNYLGIYTPSPKPKIISNESDNFETGDNGFIKVKILNDGESGQINVYADCSSGFDSSREDISLGSGKSTTVFLSLTGSGTKAVNNGKCTVYAEARGDVYDSSEVSVTVTVPTICTPNTRRCGGVSGNDILICDSEGLSEKIYKSCPEECKVINDVAQCISSGDGSKVLCDTDAFCINYFKDEISEGSCTTAVCKKGIFGGIFFGNGECLLDQKDTPECTKECNFKGFGKLIIFPDLSQSCFNSLGKLANIFYIVKIIAYFLALLLLPIFINSILKGFGLEGKKSEGKVDYMGILRIGLSIVIGWLVAVLIWTLLYLAIGLYVGIVIISFIVKSIIPASKAVSAFKMAKKIKNGKKK